MHKNFLLFLSSLLIWPCIVTPVALNGKLFGALLPRDSFCVEMDKVQALARTVGTPEEVTSRIHIRYTASVSGVLKYASARGQCVEEIAQDLTCRYMDNPKEIRRQARAAALAVAQALGSQITREARETLLAAPVLLDAGNSPSSSELHKSEQEEEGQHRLATDLAVIDAELNGRLYYCAITAVAPIMVELGLPSDVLGFCTLLALCRAASLSTRLVPFSWRGSRRSYFLDAMISNHFSAIKTADTMDGRFLLRKGFWVRPSRLASNRNGGSYDIECQKENVEAGAKESRMLVVAFSSLGSGVVRHEWRRVLSESCKRQWRRHNEQEVPERRPLEKPSASSADVEEEGALEAENRVGRDCPTAMWPLSLREVDVLHVADPAMSWFCTDAKGRWDGGRYYERNLRRVLRGDGLCGAPAPPFDDDDDDDDDRQLRGGHVPSRRRRRRRRCYDYVIMLGDSMGGSAALRFWPVAAGSSRGGTGRRRRSRAVAFVPQVDLVSDEHCARDDFTVGARRRFQRKLSEGLRPHPTRLPAPSSGFRGEKSGVSSIAEISIHCGLDPSDRQHAALAAESAARGTENPSCVAVVEHTECEGHLLTAWLKKRGALENLLIREIAAVFIDDT